MTTIPNLTNAAALIGTEYIPTAIAGQVAKRATAFNVGSLGPYTINAKSYCVGDGVADDTAGMQAAINAALAAGGSLFVPHGTYKTTAELTIGTTTTGTSSGFQMIGEGKDHSDANSTKIVLYGTSIRSIIAVQQGAWRGITLRDFNISCNTHGGASYGVVSPAAFTTNISCYRMCVFDVGIAFASLFSGQANEGNGEWFHCDECYAQFVDAFFKNESGQGFFAYMNRCDADINVGGCMFLMDSSSSVEGGGLVSVDSSFGCSDFFTFTHFSNITYVRNTDNTVPIVIIGGRIEQLTQLYDAPGTSTARYANIHFDGVQFVINNDMADSNNTIKKFISSDGHRDLIHISNCKFDASPTTSNAQGSDSIETNVTDLPDGNGVTWSGHIHWDQCQFRGIRHPLWHVKKNERFTDCEWTPVSDPNHYARVDNNFAGVEWPVWESTKFYAPSHHWGQWPEMPFGVNALTLYTEDDTVETGQYGSWASSGAVAIRTVSGRDMLVGRELPAGSCTVQIKIKASASCTQGHYFYDLNTSSVISSSVLALTSTWQAISWSANFGGLSGHSVFYGMQGTSTPHAIDIGWFIVG